MKSGEIRFTDWPSRDRQTDRQAGRQRDRGRQRQRERGRDRQAERQRETEREGETGRQTDRQRHRQTDRDTDRQTERWERDTERDRETERQRERQREREVGERKREGGERRERMCNELSESVVVCGGPVDHQISALAVFYQHPRKRQSSYACICHLCTQLVQIMKGRPFDNHCQLAFVLLTKIWFWNSSTVYEKSKHITAL